MKLTRMLMGLLAGFWLLAITAPAFSAPLSGGSLDPLLIPKYVQPLVIPPVMPTSVDVNVPTADYNIAVRQFRQQILPGGVWNSVNGRSDAFPATTVWSYGRAEDTLPPDFTAPAPIISGVTFNYPAFTIENISQQPTDVRWINDLVVNPTACAASTDKTIAACNFLPHLFPVDQTLHWANPPKANCEMGDPNRTDCMTMIPEPYTGPVPLVTHVHGAHVQPESDGYPEAWWLPGAPGTKGIPAGYGERGSVFTQADNSNTVPGSAFYSYENTQPATTLWYHDHALGMTRLNVYAGPAGFWLIRGGSHDLPNGILPGPAPTATDDPNFDSDYRKTIREIPIAIQDRSFNVDGSLFYPPDRTFFDGFTGPYIGDMSNPSDISGIWNPEAFFNTMVVNGTTWPQLEVAPARYRLRLLNGCNSRTLNLALFEVVDGLLGTEHPIYQIGGDQGFLPKVVKISTGEMTVLPGNGTIPAAVAAADPMQALLLGPAERADVIIDFSNLPNNTRIRIINTAPDAPFGGLDPADVADPQTTGQVMEFVVNDALLQPADATTTAVENLLLPAELQLGTATRTRQVSLNELVSEQVCVEINGIDGSIVGPVTLPPGPEEFHVKCAAAIVAEGNIAEPMGPRQARLGTLTTDGGGNLIAVTQGWMDPITENPLLDSTEVWEIYNTTMDAHPIHLHLVRYQVVGREDLDAAEMMMGNLVPTGITYPPLPNEAGYKDTVVAYPNQITRIKANFDIAGLYVWHCHIVEHEDNEMMRPFVVHPPVPLSVVSAGNGNGVVTSVPGGIDCGTTCTGSFPYESLVTLTAQPLAGSAFTGWSGACSGTGSCVVTMDSAKSVTATFTKVCAIIPGIYSVSSSANGNYTVSWGASATPDVTYLLYENDLQIYSGTSRSLTFSSKANGTYRYTVKAIRDAYLDSPLKGTAQTVVAMACAPISGIYGPTSSISGSYVISWGASATAGVTYLLYENGAQIYSGPNRSFAVNGRGNGTYNYTVRAIRAPYLESPLKGTIRTVVALTCGKVTSISVLNYANGLYQVRWGGSTTTGVTYDLYENSGSGWSLAYSGSNRYLNVAGKAAGTYQYKVVARKFGYTPSADSNIAMTTVTP